ALRLALLGLGIGEGYEVITTPMTFIATIEAIVQAGARPVFADIDAKTGNLSPQAVLQYLDARRDGTPRAIMPVHLYGLPAAMPDLLKLGREHGIKIVEDACQAHGARIQDGGKWAMAGTMSAAGCFSFYPGKNLGAWGEGGAVATEDERLADTIATLRDHGRTSHYEHDAYGYNARLDTIQAAVLSAKLGRLAVWNARRREIAALYRELLYDVEVELPHEPEGLESCYHLFVIRSPWRDEIRRALLDAGIQCGIHYPVPLHLQPAARALGYSAGDFPASEKFARMVLSLPMHPHLSDDDVALVAATVRTAVERMAPANAAPHQEEIHLTSK
ncbi:MAG: DegT/DnrJ/EryC1/StrS family aminotransferase, partial [Candidatus Binataceae bacterium]